MLNQLRRATCTTTLDSQTGKPKTTLSKPANLLTGASARALAGFVMSPVTVLKVRYESSLYAYTSLSSAARDIYKTTGAKGFFAGFGATAVRDAPYAGLYVLFYEQSKISLFAHLDIAAPFANFASGVLAAAAATAVTNPFDAVKTRLQLQPSKYRNALSAARMMVTEEGAMCLFDGLAIRMARKAISSALAWTVYEELIRRAEDKIVDIESP
jgi:solute carrier family 25 protein 38